MTNPDPVNVSPLNAAFERHQAGDLTEATRLYKEILHTDPHQPDALHMLGIIARQQGNNELALKLIEVALGQRTEMPLAWHNRSLILRMMDRKEEALQSARQAVSVDPNFAESWDMIGFLSRDKKDFEASREAHAKAVALEPNNLKFLGNYALLLLATGKLQQAYDAMRRIEQNDPNLLSQTMGNILKAAGHPEKAIAYYQKSREQMPDNDEIRVTEAMTRLLIGDFVEAWKIWETRPSLDARFEKLPFWNGQRVDHLLLHEDQGLGDALQCARYIPMLRGRAGRITLQVTGVLHKLFATTFPDIKVLTLDDPVPTADARIRLLSLPALFKADETNIPKAPPYIFADEKWRAVWKERLAPIPKPRIGLVWGGNPDHLNDRLRSIPFADIEPLLNAGKEHFVSLQKGGQKIVMGDGVFDADPYLGDFTDTAGLIAELDLLISVDTSVVHLAGALGKPVWLLLPFDPDWRWLLGREDSPWYASMRIFRQKEPRNWAKVIGHVNADLEKFLSGNTTVLQPPKWQGGCLKQNPNAIVLTENTEI